MKALLHSDEFYHEMRQNVIKDDLVNKFKKLFQILSTKLSRMNLTKAHGDDLFYIGILRGDMQIKHCLQC
jgi:hypothetical protein